MTTRSEDATPLPDRWKQPRAGLDEQARARGTRPIGDGTFYVNEDAFPEPGELEEFLAYVREGRRLGTVQPQADQP